MKKKVKVKEEVSDLFVRVFVGIGAKYGDYEYISEMRRVGVKIREMPMAVLEFAMDNMPIEFDRLNLSEQEEVEKRLKKYFKEVLL